MIEIALVNGNRYMDTLTKKTFVKGKTYSVSDDVGKRLLKQKNFKERFFFGRVVKQTDVPTGAVISKEQVEEMNKPYVPVIENPQAADIIEIE